MAMPREVTSTVEATLLDIDVFYWHLLNQFWVVKGGTNYFYRPSQTPYWQPGIGFEGLMYYFISNNSRFYYHVHTRSPVRPCACMHACMNGRYGPNPKIYLFLPLFLRTLYLFGS